MKKILLISALVIASFIFNSCQKQLIDENNIEQNSLNTIDQNFNQMPTIKVVDGMLKFESFDDFLKISKIVSNFTDEERNKWEQIYGFTSLKTIEENIDNQIQNAKSVEQIQTIIKSNNQYVYIEDSTVKYRVHDNTFESISNKDNLFIIDDTIYKILDNYVLKTDFNNIECMKKISKISDLNNLTNDRISFYEYVLSTDIKDNQYYESAIAATSDRKAEFTIETKKLMVIDANNYVNYYFYFTGKLQGYKKVLGLWVGYKTRLELYINEMTIMYPKIYIFENWNWNSFISNNFYNWDSGDNDVSSIEFNENISILHTSLNPPQNYFKHLRIKFKSRGLPDYCDLDYDYVN